MYNYYMKKLTVTLLIISAFVCGCTQIRTADNTLSQIDPANSTQQTANQENVLSTREQPNNKTEEEEFLHPIDKAERDCISKLDATVAMNECSYKAMDAWYKEIDKYLEKLKTVTTEEDFADILKSQENWKKFKDSEFEAVSIIMDKQGTMFQNSKVGMQSGLIKQRALFLKEFYEILSLKN